MRELVQQWRSLVVIVVGLACVGGAILIRRAHLVKSDDFWPEVTKSLLTLAVAAFAAGIIKTLLEERRRDQKEQTRKAVFRRNLLRDLKSVHFRVETARLLIAAHQSAKTYKEQMGELVNARVVLLGVKNAIQSASTDLINPKVLIEPLPSMAAYLSALGDEYRKGYKDVSILQSIDEALNNALMRKLAGDVNTPGAKEPASKEPFDTSQWSKKGWQSIDNPNEFSVLADLLSKTGSLYQQYFDAPYQTVVHALRQELAGTAARPGRAQRKLFCGDRLDEQLKNKEAKFRDQIAGQASQAAAQNGLARPPNATASVRQASRSTY